MVNAREAWSHLMLCLMAIWVIVLLLWFFRIINAEILMILGMLGMAAAVYYLVTRFQYIYDYEDFGVEGNRVIVLGSFLNFMMIIFVVYVISWF